ncbi:MAG: SAM-dependent DNA methyltransferase [Rhodoferax sp.]|nr:SAM-dependent DNA methyltransferase [Rhodoferax sp.]
MTGELYGTRPPEILFIERCWQLLKPGGRMAIVLPDGILGNPDLEYVHYWMMTHCCIVASIDLHADTFQPNNGTQTSVLLLQKKTDAEMRNRPIGTQKLCHTPSANRRVGRDG